MHHHPTSLARAAVLAVVVLMGCTDSADPGDEPAVVLTVSPTSLGVAPGGQVTASVTIVRSGGFVGPVAITGAGAPTGVTITGGIIAADALGLQLVIAASPAAVLGTVDVAVEGSADGVTIDPKSVTLVIALLPTATISTPATSASMPVGGSAEFTVSVVRERFDDELAFSGVGLPPGVFVGGTIPAGASSGVLHITSDELGDPGSASISIRAAGGGVTSNAVPIALTVTPGWRIGAGVVGEAPGDRFGTAVALAASGHRVVVGAPRNDGNGADAGHARVLERNGTAWIQVGGDIDGEAAGDNFGSAVAISDDGNRVAIGAHLNDGGGASSGTVRVYQLAGGSWTQTGSDIDGGPGETAGWSIAMNSAGTRIVAGGPGAGSATGTVRIFELSGGAWVAVGAPITAPYGFGYAVSMSDDGNRIAVGQPSGLGTNGPGYTYVYEWAASAWTQLGSGIAGPHADARAGAAVALAGDGNMLVVGAPLGQGLPDPGGFGCNSSWVQRYDLVGGVASPVGSPTGHYLCTGNDYSLQVSVSSDGNRLLSGGDTGLYAELIGGAWQVRKNWNLRSIVPAISPDGQTAVLGTPGHDASRGQVLLYALP